MKIAVPVENGVVSPAFARAPAFAIYEADDSGIHLVKTITNPYASELRGVGPLVVQMLSGEGVEVIAAPNVGPNAAGAVSALGMRYVTVPPGINPDEAARMGASGKGIVPPRPSGFYGGVRGFGRGFGMGRGFGRGRGRGRGRRWLFY